MKIAYNPSGASPLSGAPENNNDIIFDLAGKAIYVKDVKLLGTDTVYDVFKKPTSSNEGGNVGLVPVPSYTNTNTRFLREDGTWVVPTNTTYEVFTGSTLENSGKAGLVPAPSAGLKRLLLSDGTWTLKFLSYDIPANSAIKITFYSQTHATLFMRHTLANNMGVYHVSGYGTYGDTKRISIVEVTNSCSGIIYPVDGEFAIIIKNPVTNNGLYVSMTLLLGSISKIETVTSEVTKSDIWRNVLHSNNTFIKNGTININGVSITPLTQHLSLSNYVTLDTALVITGYKNFTRQVKISTAGNPLKLTSSTTYCDIVFSITNSDGTTVGSGIVLRGNADFKIFDDGWSNEYTILHSNNYTKYKHAYTNLTGSGTTANLAIVSTGTANGWTLKTLGSNAFDSTKYLPLTGGTLSGDLNFGHLSAYVKGYITWTGGTVLQRIQISDNNNTNDAVFTFLLSTNSGTDWTDLFTIKDNGYVVATSFIGNLDWSYITNKPTSFTPSAHTHTTKQITACTGYAMASQRGNVVTEDSLNTALGKIEYKALLGVTAYDLIKAATDNDGTIENLAEILKVLEGISDTDTIQAIIGKYLPLTGGTIINNKTSFPLEISSTYGNEASIRILRGSSLKGVIGFFDTYGTMMWNEAAKSRLYLPDTGGAYFNSKTLLHEGNVGNYAALKDGSNASGTWGINISGNSNTASVLKSTRYDTDDPSPNTTVGATFQFSNLASIGWCNVLTMKSYGDSNYTAAQLITPGDNPGKDSDYSGNMRWRQGRNSTWLGWKTILDSSNTYINNNTITINGASITPLTQHQSLANYVTLDTNQTITGAKTFTQALATNSYILGTKLRFITNSISRGDYLYILNSSCYTTQSSPTTHDFIVKTGLPISAHRKYYLELKGDLYSGGNTFNLIISFFIYNSGIHQFRVSGFTTCPTSTHIATYIENNIEKIAIYVKNEASSNVLQHFITLNLYKHSKDDPDFTIINATTSDINSLTIKSSINNTSNLYLGDINTSKITLIGGTSSQFLKGDGSLDSNTYLTSSGTIDYAKKLKYNTQIKTLEDLDGFLEASTFKVATFSSITGPGFAGNDGMVLSIPWASTSYGAQIIIDDNYGVVKIRQKENTTWSNWLTFLTSKNYTSYLPFLNSSDTHATNTSVIYAPSTAGTKDLVLVSNGSGAPVWKTATLLTVGTALKLQSGGGNNSNQTSLVYYKFASYTSEDITLQINLNAFFYVTQYYNSHNFGLLRAEVRFNNNGTSPAAGRFRIEWLVNSGIDPNSVQMSYLVSGNTRTINIYHKLTTTPWDSFKVIKLSDGAWSAESGTDWELHRDVQLTSLPTDEIFTKSVNVAIANTAAPVEYGLLNLCIRVSAGSSTSVTNNVLTTSGVNADTWFKLILSEPLEVDLYYTLGFYVENVPLSATLWSFGVGNQSNTNWVINITLNGWVWATGLYNGNGNSLELLIDDFSRNFYDSIKISKIVLVKGKLKAYYSPAPINLNNYTSYLGYIGTTAVQASSAAQALTGITSATISGVTSTNTLTISNTGATGHINFSRGSYNYITMPSGGSLYILPNGSGVSASNGMVFSSKGLHPAKTNSAYSLGTSSLRWDLVHASELLSTICKSTLIELNSAGGLSKYGGFIDFHFHNSDGKPTDNLGNVVEATPDYTSRIIENAAGTLNINGATFKNGYVTSTGFVKSGSSDSYILLGGGSHKAVSDFLLKSELENLELNSNTTTIEKSLQVTKDWMDTGIKYTDLPATGTYIVQLAVSGANNGTGNMYSCYWSGIMSWYREGTNDSDADEIILHRSGHAYGNTLYLRTIMTTNSDGRHLRLQIAANKDLSAAYTFKFKFKRVI